MAAIAAAHACGMKVVELQHGVVTTYHLGYSFPVDSDVVPYAPDMLFSFGRFWKESTPLPTTIKSNIIGAPYVRELAKSHEGQIAPREQVVFASQAIVTKDFMRFAVQAARLCPERSFLFRLHPSEDRQACATMFAHLSPPCNISLSQTEPTTYALLAQAEVLVGVSSTMLFEGMVLGCRIIVVDLPTAEYMDAVVARGDALKVDSPEAFSEALKSAPLCRDTEIYYAESADLPL